MNLKTILVLVGLAYAGNVQAQRAEDYLASGDEKMITHDPEAAVIDYNKAIALNPALTQAYVARAACKEALNNYTEAIADYNRAIALAQDKGKLYYLRALAQIQMGHKKKACSDLHMAQKNGFHLPTNEIDKMCR